MARVTIEVCVGSVDGVVAAEAAGADRAELCADLVEGGVTPSAGTIRVARARARLGLMVMIRPRGGDFLYDGAELEAMRHDIDVAKELEADGVVLGVLRADGTVDEERTGELAARARPLSVTFHRAFDLTPDPRAALEALVRTGVDRLLTSGQKACAADAVPLLRELVAQAGSRLVVMPGGGLRADNAAATLRATGAREIHFAALALRPSLMRWRNPGPCMGAGSPPGEYERQVTDAEAVRAIVADLRRAGGGGPS